MKSQKYWKKHGVQQFIKVWTAKTKSKKQTKKKFLRKDFIAGQSLASLHIDVNGTKRSPWGSVKPSNYFLLLPIVSFTVWLPNKRCYACKLCRPLKAQNILRKKSIFRWIKDEQTFCLKCAKIWWPLPGGLQMLWQEIGQAFRKLNICLPLQIPF